MQPAALIAEAAQVVCDRIHHVGGLPAEGREQRVIPGDPAKDLELLVSILSGRGLGGHVAHHHEHAHEPSVFLHGHIHQDELPSRDLVVGGELA
jgi:hypothetical protein